MFTQCHQQKHLPCPQVLNFLLDITSSCFINQPWPPDLSVYSVKNRPRILNFWLIAFGSDADSLSTDFQWALDQAIHGILSFTRSDVPLLLPISRDCNNWFAFSIPTRAVFTGFFPLPETPERAGSFNSWNTVCISLMQRFPGLHFIRLQTHPCKSCEHKRLELSWLAPWRIWSFISSTKFVMLIRHSHSDILFDIIVASLAELKA